MSDRNMIQRIVMCKGGVETLDYFSAELADAFTELGFSVFFHDLNHPNESAKNLCSFLKQGKAALVTFNFEGLQKEKGIYRESDGYLWDTYGVTCYNIAADHPYYYHEQLSDLPKQYFHLSVDRNHQNYFRKFYPEYREAGFLPLAGMPPGPKKDGTDQNRWRRKTVLCGGAGIEMQNEAVGIQNRTERPIDVLMAGNYVPLSVCEPYIHQRDEEYAAFYQGILDELIACPKFTVEEAAIRHCERELGEISYEQLRITMNRMLFLDLYIRNYWRGLAVKTLAEAGITVDVVGKGWEELPCRRPDCLRIHPQTDTENCLRMFGASKISLNVMPWFKDGAHDRVFSSVLNGALCVTDGSRYLCEQLRDGEGVCYYKLEELSDLPAKVQYYLDRETARRTAAEAGYEAVMHSHRWDSRVGQLALLLP